MDAQEVETMHYKEAMKELIKKKSWTMAALAKKLGLSRNQISVSLRTENARSGMTMESYLKYARALGAHVYLEWVDEGDARRKYRWEIDDS